MPEGQIHLLVVEDLPSDVFLVQRALNSLQGSLPRISYKETLGEALIAIENEGVQVVLLDLNLPDSDGLETLESVRQAAPSLPVLVLTGNVEPGLREACMAAGAREFVPKGSLDPAVVRRALAYVSGE